MKLKVRCIGNSKAILLSRSETDLWDLKDGDTVDVKIDKPIDWKEMRRRVSSNS